MQRRRLKIPFFKRLLEVFFLSGEKERSVTLSGDNDSSEKENAH